MRALLAGLLLLVSAQAFAESRVDLPTRSGVTVPVFATFNPKATSTLILFVGGNGLLSKEQDNFLLRIKPKLIAAGFNVVVPDDPSDKPDGINWPFRASEPHQQDLLAIIDWARKQSAAPVFLIGTSNGSVSAANGAAFAGREVRGVVLTSSVWNRGMKAIPQQQIVVPILIVHNHDDKCPDSPFSGTDYEMKRVGRTTHATLLAVSGGQSQGDACGEMSPHGFLGIEDSVVAPMIEWIRNHHDEH